MHHIDRGSQFTSIRYSERLGEIGAVAFVGLRGDSYDNAVAESVIGLYKTELVANRGFFAGVVEIELATLGMDRLVEPPSPAQRHR